MDFSKTKSSPIDSPFMVSGNNVLWELGEKYKPTKRWKNYLPYYWLHFRDIRFTVKKMVEIGLQTDASIKMWEEFFPNATIYGIDLDAKCKKLEGDRRRVFIGDQGNAVFLQSFIDITGGGFDVVIDDGSHRIQHQLFTFETLFPALSSHGIYAIEDVGGCVGDEDLVTVNEIKKLINNVDYWPAGLSPREWSHLTKFDDGATWADKNIIGVAFYRWLVFVMKGLNPQDNPYLTER